MKSIPDKLLFLDTETGGIDPSTSSLLSIGLAVWSNYSIINSIEILTKEENLRVDHQALIINNINLDQHLIDAHDSKETLELITDFLEQNFEKEEKVTLVGHNIGFDIGFLKTLFKKHNYRYEQYFSHRSVDTASILYFLYLSGRMKNKIISSDAAFKEFSITVPARHSALSDCLATVELFNKLLQLDQDILQP